MKVSSLYLHLLIAASSLRCILAYVLTSSGPIIGTTDVFDNKTLNVYLGVPFATPPIGNLRFRRTVPVQPWSTPLKADAYPPACVQYFPYKWPWSDWMDGQSEDCLYLNIWAPSGKTEGSGKAVMFWIYGGGFTKGSNRINAYNGNALAARGDVVVVTVNYRLGVFGFLSTPSEEAPGNMGLYDILEGLKWVKNNIEAFGGDPNRITLFGQSVGAFTSGIFCVSPLAKGLFQRVILESGAPTRLADDGSYAKNLELAGKLSVEVGCAPNNGTVFEDPRDVVQCLRERDADYLAVTTQMLSAGSPISFNFIPGDALLPTNSRIAIRNLKLHDVDVLLGNVQDEGSFHLTSRKTELCGPFGEKNPSINKTLGESIVREIFEDFPFAEAVVQRYLGRLGEYDYDTIRSQVYHSDGDFSFVCPTLYFAESYARKGNSVYFYYFNHRPSVSPWAPWMGVVHFSEVPFLFGRPLDGESQYSEGEEAISMELIAMWSDFAKYGVPSSKWPVFSRQKPYVLTFSQPEDKENYLTTHLANCNFFRPYFGFP